MQIVRANLSCTACFNNLSVFNITPSAASTNNTTPSHILIAAVASSEKLTCPKRINQRKIFRNDFTHII